MSDLTCALQCHMSSNVAVKHPPFTVWFPSYQPAYFPATFDYWRVGHVWFLLPMFQSWFFSEVQCCWPATRVDLLCEVVPFGSRWSRCGQIPILVSARSSALGPGSPVCSSFATCDACTYDMFISRIWTPTPDLFRVDGRSISVWWTHEVRERCESGPCCREFRDFCKSLGARSPSIGIFCWWILNPAIGRQDSLYLTFFATTTVVGSIPFWATFGNAGVDVDDLELSLDIEFHSWAILAAGWWARSHFQSRCLSW